MYEKGRLSMSHNEAPMPSTVSGFASDMIVEMLCWKLPYDKTFYRARLLEFIKPKGNREPSIVISWLRSAEGGPPPEVAFQAYCENMLTVTSFFV